MKKLIIKFKSVNHKDEPDNPKKYHKLEVEIPNHCLDIKEVFLIEEKTSFSHLATYSTTKGRGKN